MVEENPRVGRRMKSDTERLEGKDFGGGGKGEKKCKKIKEDSL